MTVLAVKPGKKPTKIELKGTLESMQEFVGGTIQAIYPFDDPVAIICNDEGKLGDLNTTVPSAMKRVQSMILSAAPFSSAVWARKNMCRCLNS